MLTQIHSNNQISLYQHLHKIYNFLTKSQRNRDLLFQHKIILLCDFTFSPFQKQETSKQLQVKQNLPQIYEKLADYLKIQYKNLIIHEEFQCYFKSCISFDQEKIKLMILQQIKSNYKSDNAPNIAFLGKFLTSFNVKHSLFPFAIKFQAFQFTSSILPCVLGKDQVLLKLNEKEEKELSGLFSQSLTTYLSQTLKTCMCKSDFVKLLKPQFTNWIDILNDLLSYIKKFCSTQSSVNLAWDENFYESTRLKYFDIKTNNSEFPNEQDITFYDSFYAEVNSLRRGVGVFSETIYPIMQSLLHPQIKLVSRSAISKVDFQTLFSPFVIIYSSIKSVELKTTYLDYIYKIYSLNSKNKSNAIKYNTFKSIIKIRHSEQLSLMKDLTDEERDFLFIILKDRKEMVVAKKLMDQYKFTEVNAIVQQYKRDKQVKQKSILPLPNPSPSLNLKSNPELPKSAK